MPVHVQNRQMNVYCIFKIDILAAHYMNMTQDESEYRHS